MCLHCKTRRDESVFIAEIFELIEQGFQGSGKDYKGNGMSSFLSIFYNSTEERELKEEGSLENVTACYQFSL